MSALNSNPSIPDFYVGSVVPEEDLRFRDDFIKDLWDD